MENTSIPRDLERKLECLVQSSRLGTACSKQWHKLAKNAGEYSHCRRRAIGKTGRNRETVHCVFATFGTISLTLFARLL